MIAILKAVTVGVVGAGLTYFRYPKGTQELFGSHLSLSIGVGVAVMTGSLVAELFHSYVFPHIHALDKASEPVSAIVAGASCSAGAMSVFYLSDPQIINSLGLPMIVLGSVLSEVTGDYLFTKFINPML